MSAYDALAYVDKSIDNVEGLDIAWRNDEVLAMLRDLREQLTKDPDWSEVQESNLRARLAAVEAELDAERMAEQFAALLYTSALRHVEGERDRARALAVRLEADLALASSGIQRRVL